MITRQKADRVKSRRNNGFCCATTMSGFSHTRSIRETNKNPVTTMIGSTFACDVQAECSFAALIASDHNIVRWFRLNDRRDLGLQTASTSVLIVIVCDIVVETWKGFRDTEHTKQHITYCRVPSHVLYVQVYFVFWPIFEKAKYHGCRPLFDWILSWSDLRRKLVKACYYYLVLY